MVCRELVELVTDYLEGALSQRDHGRFEHHLRECDHCNDYLEQIRTTVRLTSTAGPEALPATMRDRLLRAFRDWRGDSAS
jgi:anti-sigma factor RsiW